MNPELTALREQIDEVDRQLVALFRQRMAISKIVAANKKAHGLPTLDPDRERALLTKVRDQAGEKLADYVEAVFRSILSASRSYQNGVTKPGLRCMKPSWELWTLPQSASPRGPLWPAGAWKDHIPRLPATAYGILLPFFIWIPLRTFSMR